MQTKTWMQYGAVLTFSLMAVVAFSAQPAFAEPEGQKIFLQHKCQGCHSVETLGIKADEAAAKGGDADEEAGEKSEKKIVDLSGTGADHDAGWLKKYLKKSVKKEGKAHRKRFKGSKEELDTLATWLETLKTKKKS